MLFGFVGEVRLAVTCLLAPRPFCRPCASVAEGEPTTWKFQTLCNFVNRRRNLNFNSSPRTATNLKTRDEIAQPTQVTGEGSKYKDQRYHVLFLISMILLLITSCAPRCDYGHLNDNFIDNAVQPFDEAVIAKFIHDNISQEYGKEIASDVLRGELETMGAVCEETNGEITTCSLERSLWCGAYDPFFLDSNVPNHVFHFSLSFRSGVTSADAILVSVKKQTGEGANGE